MALAVRSLNEDASDEHVRDKLIVALDVDSKDEARRIVDELDDVTSFFKIGLRLQFGGGIELARELAREGKKVFLDSKLFDIEETIVTAVEQVVKMGVTFLTVHGDEQVVRAAVKGKNGSALKILAVTLLTSLDDSDLKEMGYPFDTKEYVRRRTKFAMRAQCDGVISSGKDIGEIREISDSKLLIVTPGIRPMGDSAFDQKRIATPGQAIRAGADHLVVGRPILRAQNRRDKAKRIIDEIAGAIR